MKEQANASCPPDAGGNRQARACSQAERAPPFADRVQRPVDTNTTSSRSAPTVRNASENGEGSCNEAGEADATAEATESEAKVTLSRRHS